MTRPHIIRADTIDLQDQDAPSAKDHSRHPITSGQGSPAPHQADALRHVELEISEQHGRSPRASQDLSGKELQLLHDEDIAHDRDPNHNLLGNSTQNGAVGAEEEMDGVEGDDGMDDDMIDKISSSPSIGEDGGYILPLAYAPPGSYPSAFPPAEKGTLVPQDIPSDDMMSSSPFSETPKHFPLFIPQNAEEPTPSKDHHHKGLYTKEQRTQFTSTDDLESEKRDQLSPMVSEQIASTPRLEIRDARNPYGPDFDPNDFHHLLLPTDDPLLGDKDFDAELLREASYLKESSPSTSSSSWEDEAIGEINDDDTEEISYVDEDRFVDSGWGGECLRETEEIDFDFVYALHTFVATVEGQANATKGDTMVLLDDSNSYWWLVRVVKDSSIGYLPAEHIETPTERLARLNKHRNLDLSQTMLTDQEDDRKGNPLNPLKKAMRRRNVKTVQFAPPTYVEPSDYGASSDEEEEEGGEELAGQEEEVADGQSQEQTRNGIDATATETTSAREPQTNGKRDLAAEQDARNGAAEQATAAERSRASDEFYDRPDDGTAAKSRKGTVRNTDSFFKDDGVETRKINLTPSLLRDDSSSTFSRSSESTLKTRPSLDSLEKDAAPEKGKDKKEKKEKKGMLGGMFRRKDKKAKGQEKEADDVEKTSSEISRQSPQPKESMESLSSEAARLNPQPHRQTSKLQKSPPAKLSPKNSYISKESSLSLQKPSEEHQTRNSYGGIIPADTTRTGPSLDLQERPILRTKPSLEVQTGPSLDLQRGPSPNAQAGPNDQLGATPPEPSRAPPPPVQEANPNLEPGPSEPQRQHRQQKSDDTPSPLAFQSRELRSDPGYQLDSPPDAARGIFSANGATASPISVSSQARPDQLRQTPHRAPLDDFDSSSTEETAPSTAPGSERPSQESQPDEPFASSQHPHLALAEAAQHESFEHRPTELLSKRSREQLLESPVEELAPHQPQPHQQYPTALLTSKDRTTPHQPPPLVTDTSSPETTSLLSPSESPSLIEAPLSQSRDPTITTNTSSTHHYPAPSTFFTTNNTPLNTSTTTNATTAATNPSSTADRTALSTSSTTSTTPTWSDASLRLYMDNGDEDIRDLLLIVNDKTGVVAQRDHPVVKGLYKEENRRLDALEGQLDGLLGGCWGGREAWRGGDSVDFG